MIELRNIRKEYESAVPIEDLSTVIETGDVISIIGPSGTGKSTLLRMINMLDKPSSGQIFIDGEEITAPGYPLHKLREKAAMVFQSFNLFNHMTVIENVTFAPIKLKNADPAEAYRRGMELLGQVGLTKAAFQYPDQLSGGQKQRAAIARTLAMDPDIILFDEPTSALDPTMVGEVEKVIGSLCGKGYTMLLVTHDMKFAESVATRTLFLCDGGIYEDGTPEQIFHNPQKIKTREFIDQCTEFNCVITDKDSSFPEFYSRLNEYSLRTDMSQKTKEMLKGLFEEIIFQVLIPELRKQEKAGSRKDGFEIEFRVFSSTRGDGTVINVLTDDLDIDIQNDYPISFKLIEACAQSIEFEKKEDNKKLMIVKVNE